MITISNFKDIILSKAGGKPLGKVPNFYSMLYQAMIEMKSKTDIPSAIRTTQLINPIFTDIDEYPIPTDTSLGGIINVRPIVADDSFYDYNRMGQRQYRVEKKYGIQNRFAIKNNNGLQYLMLSADTTSSTLINACDSLTANGTVAVLGVSTNVALDAIQKLSSGNSISFKTGIGTTNGFDITGMTPVNLSNLNDLTALVYLPTIASVTGVQLSYGQSSSHFYSGATAVDFFGNALSVGWNLIRIPKTSFSITAGSPTWNGVTYTRVQILGSLAVATDGFRVDSITAQLGAIYEMDYYSNYHFQTVAGVRIEKPTTDSDYIVLQDDELALFLGFFIEIMAVDLKQTGATIDVQEYGGQKLIAKTEEFKLKYPSQRQLPATQYGYRPHIT